MVTSTYPIDADNAAEPIDTRPVADMPAEFRALKTKVNTIEAAFGAVCDGVTDDTAAVQAAINAAYGKRLLIPNGVCLVSELSVTASISVDGTGTLKQKAGTVGHMITVSGTSTKFIARGITFDGNEQGQAVASPNCSIRFAAVGTGIDPAVLDVSGCTLKNGSNADISVVNDAVRSTVEKVLICGNRFLGGREGTAANYDPRYIDIRCPVDYVVSNNVFDLMKAPANFGRAGIISYDANAAASLDKARGVISGNQMVNCGRNEASSTLGAIDIYNYARTVSVIGNSLTGSLGRGIQVKADAENISIVGNVIDGLTGIDAQISVNGSVDAFARGSVTVQGNTCLNSAQDGISCVGRNSGSTIFARGLSISGNVVKGAVRRGIAAIDWTDATIVSNVVDTCESGIYLEGIKEAANVAANHVTDPTGNAIYVSPTSATAWLTITGNNLRDCGSRGIYVGAAAGGIIANNNIKDPSSTAIDLNNINGPLFLVTGNVTNAASPFSAAGTPVGLRVQANLWSPELGFGARSKTIAAGAITVYLEWHYVDTEGAAATDDLDTINGGYDGVFVTLRANNSSRDVVMKDGTGNLKLNGDFTMNNSEDSITLRFMGNSWIEMSRSDNGV